MLGGSGHDAWPEIWHQIGPMIETVRRDGTASWSAPRNGPEDGADWNREVAMRRLTLLLKALWTVAFVALFAHVAFFVVVMEKQVRLHF